MIKDYLKNIDILHDKMSINELEKDVVENLKEKLLIKPDSSVNNNKTYYDNLNVYSDKFYEGWTYIKYRNMGTHKNGITFLRNTLNQSFPKMLEVNQENNNICINMHNYYKDSNIFTTKLKYWPFRNEYIETIEMFSQYFKLACTHKNKKSGKKDFVYNFLYEDQKNKKILIFDDIKNWMYINDISIDLDNFPFDKETLTNFKLKFL